MRTINYQSYFDFGKGVDSIGESACGQAVEATQAAPIQAAAGQLIQFRLDIVEYQEHFQKVLGISAAASLRYGIPSIAGAGGDAKFGFSEENTFSEYNLNVLARVSVANPVLMLKNPKLLPEARSLYERSVAEFERK